MSRPTAPTVGEIRERLARAVHPYTDAIELRVLIARIDQLEEAATERAQALGESL